MIFRLAVLLKQIFGCGNSYNKRKLQDSLKFSLFIIFLTIELPAKEFINGFNPCSYV